MNTARPSSRLSFSPFLVLALSLILVACQAAQVAPPAPTVAATTPAKSLKIAGAGGTLSVLRLLADAYGKQHQDLTFEFLSGAGQSGGIKGVMSGEFDLVAMGRKLKDTEPESQLVYLGFGADKIVFGVTPGVTVKGLTKQQLKDIFLGNTTNWSAVGGGDEKIVVFLRDEEDTNTVELRKVLFGDGPFATGSVVMTSGNDMQAALMRQTSGIGYLTFSGIRLEKLDIRMLAVDGQDPTDTASTYPYTRDLGLAYLPANLEKARPFIDYVASPEAQKVLADYGLGLQH